MEAASMVAGLFALMGAFIGVLFRLWMVKIVNEEVMQARRFPSATARRDRRQGEVTPRALSYLPGNAAGRKP